MKNKILKSIACLALVGSLLIPVSVFASNPPITYNIGDGVLSTLPEGSPKIEDQGYGKDKKEDVVRVNQDVRVNIAPLIKAGAENIKIRFWKDETDRNIRSDLDDFRNTPLLYTLNIENIKVDSGKKKAGDIWQYFEGYVNYNHYNPNQSSPYESSKKIVEETNGEMFVKVKHFDPGDLWLEITYKLNGENKKQTIHMYVDPEDRFLGEVKGSDFISGIDLSKLIGLGHIGEDINTNIKNQWLKYQQGDGTITYVAKKPMKQLIDWDSINDVGAVYGKDININNNNYKVRLLKGRHINYWSSDDDIYTGYINIGSEWNRLLYPVSHHTLTSENQNFYYGCNVGARIPHWAGYSMNDLGFIRYQGESSWCQGSRPSSFYSLCRGDGKSGVSYSGNGHFRGWRPAVDFLPLK